MKDKQLENLMAEAGLNETEILIYLSLLKKPAATKWDLKVRTGLERNKVYRACERLEALKLIGKNRKGISALTLAGLIEDLLEKQKNAFALAQKLKQYSGFSTIPTEAIEEFDTAVTQEKILEQYIKMSQINYDTCLDFGDLEGFVPVLGGMDPVFKFRVNRYKQNAKNMALCTTTGPFTSCMARKNDMERFKSTIETMKISFKDKWIIFSDTADYLMINDFANPEAPSSVLIKSKLLADSQRMQFRQFCENMKRF